MSKLASSGFGLCLWSRSLSLMFLAADRRLSQLDPYRDFKNSRLISVRVPLLQWLSQFVSFGGLGKQELLGMNVEHESLDMYANVGYIAPREKYFLSV